MPTPGKIEGELLKIQELELKLQIAVEAIEILKKERSDIGRLLASNVVVTNKEYLIMIKERALNIKYREALEKVEAEFEIATSALKREKQLHQTAVDMILVHQDIEKRLLSKIKQLESERNENRP